MKGKLLVAIALAILLGWSHGASAPAAAADAVTDSPLISAASLPVPVTTVVASTTVSPLSFTFQPVSCPSGAVALGGGVDVEDRYWIEVTSSGPTFSGIRLFEQGDGTHSAPDGWQASVYNYSALHTYSLKVAVICAPVSGVSAIVASANISPLYYNEKSAACPSGRLAVGGGVDTGSLVSVTITSSGPTFSGSRLFYQANGAHAAPDGWLASAYNGHSSNTYSLVMAVICAPLSAFGTVVASINLVPHSYNVQSAGCPSGGVGLGGGVDVANISSVHVTSSAPMFAGARLISQPDGANPAPDGWAASAYNRDLATSFSIKVAVSCNYGLYLPAVIR
jgi:hypothetical protein